MTPRLTVSEWSAWASGLTTQTDWMQWFEKPVVPTDENKAAATKVAPLLRRRLTPLGRAAIEAITTIYNETDREVRTPVIFASRWGDIALSVKLLQELTAAEGLSPMGFSTSVHNGIGGLFSISQKHRANITALASAESCAGTAMIEACGLLHEKAESVIVVVYEERSPKAFRDFHPQNFTFAWAARVRLAQPNEIGFTISPITPNHPMVSTDTTVSLQALRFLIDPEVAEHLEAGYPIAYQWTKNSPIPLK